MPEPIVIKDSPAPAVAPEGQPALAEDDNVEIQGEEKLLAGKYKNVDELIKGYKELEQRMSQPQEEEEGELEEDDQGRNARDIYGEFVGSALEEAGVDYADMSDRFAQEGRLNDNDYSELQRAGFSRDMVDNYLAGLNYNAANDAALTQQEVMQLKQDFGGAEEYDRMVTWASQNLEPDEIEAFDQLVQNSRDINQTRLAVAGLYAQYTAQEGREPQLIGGRAGSGQGTRFESTAQVIEAMNDPRYASDPAYRQSVVAKLGRSNVL